MAHSISCPTCGAPHDVTPGIAMYLCSYCANAVYWDTERIHSAGKQAVLDEGFTRLYTGAAGSFHQKRFLVRGRARYSFGGGFWDEWYLEMSDGTYSWLTEDNHELAVQWLVQSDEIAPYTSYGPGAAFSMRDQLFMVQEVGTATCIGIEGDLPKRVVSGETYPYVDASSPDGRYTLGIEYDDDRPTVFCGKWLKHAELKLDDEGAEW